MNIDSYSPDDCAEFEAEALLLGCKVDNSLSHCTVDVNDITDIEKLASLIITQWYAQKSKNIYWFKRSLIQLAVLTKS